MSYIYILYESTFTSNYFYVGKTNNPTQRIREHFRTIEFYGNTPKNNWIRKYNKTIAMKILCEVPQYLTWQEAEKQWISFLKWCNVKLLNLTDGGDGMNGSSFSEEHKNKLKIARKGRKPSLGMKHSEDAKLKISMANSGINHHQFNKPVSIETKRKISSAKIGKCSGVKNPAAIIDNMIAKQIRNKYANLNYTYMQLAKEYNISCSTVGRVIRGENWK